LNKCTEEARAFFLESGFELPPSDYFLIFAYREEPSADTAQPTAAAHLPEGGMEHEQKREAHLPHF